METQAFDNDHLWTLAASQNAAEAMFSYAHAGLMRDVGCGLLTASVYDVANMRSRRVFSENPEAYPVGNFKRLDRNRYFEVVLEGKQPFSSTTIEDIAEVFFDWQKIKDLGFESNLNIPAVANGTVIGTFNLLAPKGYYHAERVQRALAWQPVITLSFLLLLATGREDAAFGASSGRPSSGAGQMEGVQD